MKNNLLLWLVALFVLLVSRLSFLGHSQTKELRITDQTLGTLAVETEVVTGASSTPSGVNSKTSKACVVSLTYTYKAGVTVFNTANLGTGVCLSTSLTLYYSDTEKFVSSRPLPTASNYYWDLGNLASQQKKMVSLVSSNTSASTGQTEACATSFNGKDSCVSLEAVVSPVPNPVIEPVARPVDKSRGYGVWIWDDVSRLSNTAVRERLDSVQAAGFDTIFLTIDPYFSLSSENQKVFLEKTEKLLSLAQSKGISVDAEAGWRDWSVPGNWEKARNVISTVAEFNRAQAIPFRGIQFDIEPYLLETYEDNKAQTLFDYLGMVEYAISNNITNQRLSFVVPHFYDCQQGWTPQITFNGKNDCAFNHLLGLLDKSPKSEIIIMAYRNSSNGSNGSIALSQVEIDAAQNHQTKIIIAQETGNVEPGFVTFYNTSQEKLKSELSNIAAAFKNKGSFGGIAIHYLDPYLELK